MLGSLVNVGAAIYGAVSKTKSTFAVTPKTRHIARSDKKFPKRSSAEHLGSENWFDLGVTHGVVGLAGKPEPVQEDRELPSDCNDCAPLSALATSFREAQSKSA